MPSDSLLGLNNLSPHYMSVKVLGYTGLPFFIPAGLTALRQWNCDVNKMF